MGPPGGRRANAGATAPPGGGRARPERPLTPSDGCGSNRQGSNPPLNPAPDPALRSAAGRGRWGLRDHGRTRPGLLAPRRGASGGVRPAASGAMFTGQTGGLAPSPPRWFVRTGYSSPSWPLRVMDLCTGWMIGRRRPPSCRIVRILPPPHAAVQRRHAHHLHPGSAPRHLGGAAAPHPRHWSPPGWRHPVRVPGASSLQVPADRRLYGWPLSPPGIAPHHGALSRSLWLSRRVLTFFGTDATVSIEGQKKSMGLRGPLGK